MPIFDTVSGRHVDVNRGLVSSLYNPYAALLRHVVRALAALYPPFVLLVTVATGNHSFLDAAAGALVAALPALLTRGPAMGRSIELRHTTYLM